MISKITILEPHFDGAQFGPASLGSQDATRGDEAETATGTERAEPTTETSGGGRIRPLLLGCVAAVAVVLGAALVWRVRAGRGGVGDSAGDQDEAGDSAGDQDEAGDSAGDQDEADSVELESPDEPAPAAAQ